VWKVGDNINTDLIIPGPYLTLSDINQKAQYVLESVIPRFAAKVKKGDILVAGKNFGSGSSREVAPLLLKHLGVSLIIAESFARIFFRNAINIGLPVVKCEGITGKVETGEILEVDLSKGWIRNETKNEECYGTRLPNFLLEIIVAGGALELLKQRRGKILSSV
jgi:3-isopropylmalate/(R)-2-methylmalate dehydratase small subunit